MDQLSSTACMRDGVSLGFAVATATRYRDDGGTDTVPS